MPLVPYPARSARHLPHAGKALSVVILFLHVSCIRFDDARKAVFSYRSLPHWEGVAERSKAELASFWGSEAPLLFAFPFGEGRPRNGARVLSLMAHLRRSFLLFFIPLEPYPARFARHLPHAGKALCRGYCFFTHACIRSDDMGIALLSYRSLPHWGRGDRAAALGCSCKRRT